jgi:hypothetical protein
MLQIVTMLWRGDTHPLDISGRTNPDHLCGCWGNEEQSAGIGGNRLNS